MNPTALTPDRYSRRISRVLRTLAVAALAAPALAGRVLYAFAPGPNAIPLARAGKLQILVTTSPAGAR